MKEINSEKENDSIKEYSFAKCICEMRLKRNLTQKALADKIKVSDRTISKWENGLTVPDLHNIRSICKELGVSADSIVLEKRRLSDYFKSFFNLLAKLWKHIFNNIFKLIFVIIFILLLIYFINNYNALSIYLLNYDSDNIKIGNGYFIRSKVRNILLIDNIELINATEDISSYKLELYTLVNGDKVIIYEDDELEDISIDELTSYPDAFRNDVVRAITQGLYLSITVTDIDNEETVYDCTINFKKNFSNDQLTYSMHQTNTEYDNDYQRYLDDDTIEINKQIYTNFNTSYINSVREDVLNNEVSEARANVSENKLEDLGYSYDENSETYTKVDGNKTITYKTDFNMLISKEMIDGNEHSMYYYIDKDRIYYEVYDYNKTLILQFKYFVSSNDLNCKIGNCKNYYYQIDYILQEYQAILNIL